MSMKKILAVCTVLLLGLLGLAMGSVYYVYTQWQQPSSLKEPVLLEIPRGYNATQIGNLLQKNGAIESANAFKWWCRFHPGKTNFKTGWYEIPVGHGIEQIAELLSSGKTTSVKVTIPEGKVSWEIAEILAGSPLKLDSAKLDSLMHNQAFADSLDVKSKDLEGYLLPNTYIFSYGTNEHEVIKAMVRENLKLRDELQAKNSPIWNELGSWHKVLTLASIVEKETGLQKERPRVAGVFLNRLRKRIPLGACPTVRFIFRNPAGPIYKSQIANDSPYNTRKYVGLMPGPISNPGRLAIEAVLFPMQTDDLYFVSKDDGSHEHYFSKTLEEHNHYRGVAARNRGAR